MDDCYQSYNECKQQVAQSCFYYSSGSVFCPASSFSSEIKADYCFTGSEQCKALYGDDCATISFQYCHKDYELYLNGWDSRCVDDTNEDKQLCTVFCGKQCKEDFPWGYCCNSGPDTGILIAILVPVLIFLVVVIVVTIVLCELCKRRRYYASTRNEVVSVSVEEEPKIQPNYEQSNNFYPEEQVQYESVQPAAQVDHILPPI